MEAEEITKEEVWKAVKALKTGKAAGTDEILGEFIKFGGEKMVDALHKLFREI